MRFVIATVLVCLAAIASAAPTTEAPEYRRGGRVWAPIDDPDVNVMWVQTPVPYPYGNALDSQLDDCYPFFVQVADDFACSGLGLVLAVEWWGMYWDPGPPAPPDHYFIIEFWTDNPGPPSHPETLIHQDTCYVFTEDYDADYEQYHYVRYLDRVFPVEEDEIYWISIYAAFCTPPRWGWCTGEPPWNDCASFYGPIFGYTEWTSSEVAWGECYDMAFVLYGLWACPVEESSWGSIKAMFR